MALPGTTRKRLRELLDIPLTGQTSVSTTGSESVLISDGVTQQDLDVITVHSLREFLGERAGDEREFPRLWTMAVMKADMTLSELGKQLKEEESISTVESAVTVKNETPIQEESTKV